MVERVTVVELTYRGCSLSYGTSPCTAAGALSQACFNTTGTCQDVQNFDHVDVSEYYVGSDVASQNVPGLVGAKPFLLSVSQVAAKMNFAGSEDSFDGFGLSSRLNVTFSDALDSGFDTDPYRDDRSVDYRNSGTYWGKWVKRHKYPKNMKLRVYEGEAGQTLAEMRSRLFFVSGVSDPTSGVFTITARDIMTYLDERAPEYPSLSAGKLSRDMDEADDFMDVLCSSSEFITYGEQKTVRVGDEIITFTGGLRNISTGIARFTGLTRGDWGTEASSHSSGDAVQRCVVYDDQRIDDVIADVLENTGVPSTYLDLAQWASKVDFTFPNLRLTRVLSEPSNGREIVSNIQKQLLLNMWWNPYDEVIRMEAVDGYVDEPVTLDDDKNIMPGLQFSQDPSEQVTRVLVSHSINDQTDPSRENADLYAIIDTTLEGLTGEALERFVLADWVRKETDVFDVAGRYKIMYASPPRKVRFQIDSKDDSLYLGDRFRLSHVDEYDELGQPVTSEWIVTSHDPRMSGETIEIEAFDVSAFGKLWVWESDAEPDYSGGEVDASYWNDDDDEIASGVTGALWG